MIFSDGELRNVEEASKHGLGCTVFWPGSHRHVECVHLGSVAATSLGAVVSGAPLRAGGALIYDYRLVHCAAPNDYKPGDYGNGSANTPEDGGVRIVPDGDRPILQLVYTVKDYNDVGNNYVRRVAGIKKIVAMQLFTVTFSSAWLKQHVPSGNITKRRLWLAGLLPAVRGDRYTMQTIDRELCTIR